MTRIDPKQLLSTLSVLLAPDGGIRSVEEVPRIVQLMQKFSKKLVSKCIYIHILRSSSPDLLEQFLSLKGWDLLNSWFCEALKNTNYYLCGDLVKLFALCPMTAKRLSENSDKNQAPKLIRQLSCDNRIEAEIRNLSLQVIQQWMSVARSAPKQAPPRPQSPLELHPIPDVDDDYSEDYVPPTKKMKPKPKPKPKLEKKPKNPPKSAMTKKPAKSRIIMDSESESENEKPCGKVARMGSVSSAGEEDKISKPKPLTAKEIRLQLLNDDSDVDELLMTDSEDDLTKKTEVIKKVEKKKEVVDLKLKEKHQREMEREFKRRKERERERREQKAKPYSRTELRKELENGEKDKIKKIAERLKEENKGKSLTAGLGRIPKLPKKEPVAAKNGNSFDSILGSMDVKTKSVKVPPMKNKNKDLLNSLAGSPDKPKSKSAIEKEIIAKEKRREEDREARRREEEEEKRLEEERRKEKECEDRLKEEEEKRLQEEKAKEEKAKEEKAKEEKAKEERELKRKEEKEEKKREERRKEEKHKDKLPKAEKMQFERRDSNSSDSGRQEKKSEKIRFGEKPRSGEKRPSVDDSPKVKKVVTVIKESNMFGDVLSSIMNDDKEKIKKRKIAERRAERKAKEQEESRKRDEKRKEEKERKKDEKEKIDEKEVKNEKVEKSPSSSPEPVTQDENNSDEVPFGGLDNREVKGILIYARGFKNKKRLSWTPDNNLVKIEYFDCDETERTNVYKQKMTFVEMKQKEKEMEKMKLNEKPEAAWTLIPLDFKHPVEYGNDSKEREVQSEREMRVLCSFYLENQLPQDPTEPEPCKPSDVKPKPIPQIDLNSGITEGADDSTTDFAPAGWPPILKGGSQEPLSDFDRLRGEDPVVEEPVKPAATKLSDILSTFKPGLLEDIVRMTSMSKSEPNEKSTKPEIQLPANFNVPPPNFTAPPAAPHQFPESDRGHHNNHNYRHRRGPMRSGHGDRPFPYAGRPCTFWMEKGNCIKGDRCSFSHPPRNGFKY